MFSIFLAQHTVTLGATAQATGLLALYRFPPKQQNLSKMSMESQINTALARAVLRLNQNSSYLFIQIEK